METLQRHLAQIPSPISAPGRKITRNDGIVSPSVSRIAGHLLSATDRYSPIADAQMRVHTRGCLSRDDGGFELPLDSLPAVVELEIIAKGFHTHREQFSWASVASGGLILRDFYLVPESVPLVRARMTERLMQARAAMRPAEPDEAEFEELELELDEAEEDDVVLQDDDSEPLWMGDETSSEALDWEDSQLYDVSDDELLDESSLEPHFFE